VRRHRRRGARGGRRQQPRLRRREGGDAHQPAHLHEPDDVHDRDRPGRRERRPLHPVGRRERRPDRHEQRDGERVVGQVDAGVPGHQEHVRDAPGRHVHELTGEQDAQGVVADREPGAERRQRLAGRHRQHDDDRQRGGERPARRVLEQPVELGRSPARVQVGDERREDEVHGGEEEEEQLREPARGRVGVELGTAGEAGEDEQVGPEEELREERRRAAWNAVPDSGAHLRRARGRVAEPRRTTPPERARGDEREQPGDVVGGHRRHRIAAGREGNRGEREPGERLSDPEHVERRAHLLEAAGGAQVHVRRRCRRESERGCGERRGVVAAREQGARREDGGDGRAHGGRDAGTAVGEASKRLAAAGAERDRRLPERGHVHPEAAAGRGHERGLHGHRDEAQPARRERAAEHDLHRERGGDAGRQPDHVRQRA
jgi:hypothetical protein